eukprot:CAMPEP_0198197780 /NCGR_PEP_ID=MMETSP1445-20131203/1340_1 /TAXON_ID=36898 /ORGANISM="Pyramimonas sp., Strain CCMP2087" /LENGTH=97 /DNA_ID=CAMNT_0043867159 /DNA_START=85 /DNA_END=378 /DNA_ORIENTATION=+
MAAFTISAVAIAPVNSVAVRYATRKPAVVCKAAVRNCGSFTDAALMNNDAMTEDMVDANTDAVGCEGFAVTSAAKKTKCIHPARPVKEACPDCPRRK